MAQDINDLKITKIEEALRDLLLNIQTTNDYITDVAAVDIEEVKPYPDYSEHELPRLFILEDTDEISHNQSFVAGQLKLQIQGLMYGATYKEKNALVNDIKRAIYSDVTWNGTIVSPCHKGLRVVGDLGHLTDPYKSFIITVVAHYHTTRSLF